MADTKSKARQKFLPLELPSAVNDFSAQARIDWINELCAGFVQPSDANKAYYRVVVEVLWPVDHGIPGPYVSEDEIRAAINTFRVDNNFGRDPHKPYVDVFRRVRELQGEEGLVGVARQGKTFQLVDLTLGAKRVPRTKLSDSDWESIKALYGHKCPACKRAEPNVRFQQDHKIPRTRGGQDGIENWQPLCDECNNFKSVACRGCELDCSECCWAYPEKFTPLKLSNGLLSQIYEYCSNKHMDPENFVADAVIGKIGSDN